MDVDLWLKGNRAPDVIASGQMIRMRSIALCLGLTTNLCHGVLQGVLHEGAESVALARGQPATPSRPSAATTPAILADISGRDFGGVRLTGGCAGDAEAGGDAGIFMAAAESPTTAAAAGDGDIGRVVRSGTGAVPAG